MIDKDKELRLARNHAERIERNAVAVGEMYREINERVQKALELIRSQGKYHAGDPVLHKLESILLRENTMTKMKIPVHKFPVCIDFCPFMEQLEKKYGFNHRDMAGKFSAEARAEITKARDAWMEANGYAGKQYVLDRPEGSKEDWPIDSEEMKLRVEINTKWFPEEGKYGRPYQDVWHWMLDYPFEGFERGAPVDLEIDSWLEEENTPDYVKTVLRAIKEEVKDHPAADGGAVTFYIDW